MSFDPDTFMTQTSEGPMATSREAIPEDIYRATIGTEQGRDVVVKNPKEGMYILDVVFHIDNPALAERLGRKVLTSRMSVWLDVDESGNLKKGKNDNVGLGRLREAVGQNTPGQPWSPSMLLGAGPVDILVTHRIDGEDTYDQVKKVTKAA